LQFDHPDIAFGLVVVEGDGEVGREAQYVVLVLIEAAEQGTGGSEFRSPAFPGPWRGWVERLAFGDQVLVVASVAGQPPGRQRGAATGLGCLDGGVDLNQEISQSGRPFLAGGLGDPGELPQMMRPA